MNKERKYIILLYQGCYGKFRINTGYKLLNIPIRLISEYIPNAVAADIDDMICFLPTGKFGKTKNGEKLEIWEPKPEQTKFF